MLIPPFPPLLYAETHYRFRYFLSFLRKREPEILADVPHRLEPGSPIPVLLIVKDADQFSLPGLDVVIRVAHDAKVVWTLKRSFSERIDSALWWRILEIPLNGELAKSFGSLEVDVEFSFVAGGRRISYSNDNYRTSSKKSLRVFRSPSPLPAVDGWVTGDAHTHSSYTNDQVEFGSPIPASVVMAKAMGLSFFCVTDHSYDLDDEVDNFLVNDPDIPKWNAQQEEIDEVNSSTRDFVVIRGEEVSCDNRMGRNVHLLLLGTRAFIPGSGDSAERWLRTTAEHTIPEVLASVSEGVVAYAGHPAERTPFLQRILLGRGEWDINDMLEKGLTGIQILNGDVDEGFSSGLQLWSRLLLRGARIFIAAGNDAHGNFSLFRQIGIPFFTIREDYRQLFGRMRTAVKCRGIDELSLLESFRRGESMITSGPLLVPKLSDKSGGTAGPGGELKGNRFRLCLSGLSSEEFGGFSKVKLARGIIGSAREEVSDVEIPSGELTFTLEREIDMNDIRAPFYIRLEAFTQGGARTDVPGICYTNPIWIKPS